MGTSRRQQAGNGVSRHLAWGLGLALAALPPAAAPAAVVPARLLTQVGDATLAGAEGLAVSNLSHPVVTGLGALGFAGTLDLGGGAVDGFAWFDGEIVWRASWEEAGLVGAQTRGCSDAGGWFLRSAIGGNPTLWSHRGLLLAQGDSVTWGSETLTVQQLGLGTASGAGTAYWRAQLEDDSGQSTWLVLASPTMTAGDILLDVAPDARFGGYPVADSGVSEFDVSRDGKKKAYSVELDVAGSGKSSVVVAGAIVAQAGQPTGDLPGETWHGTVGLDIAVNTAGAAAFEATTSAATEPQVLAYVRPAKLAAQRRAAIVLREGDCVGTDGDAQPCLVIEPETDLRTVALSEGGALAHLWVESFAYGAGEYLFYSCNPAAAEAATLLLSTADAVDLDGDGQGDAGVDRVGLPGEQQVAFGGGKLYVGAELDYGAATVEALLELELPVCLGRAE